jgi:hypothetical protein
MNEEMIQENELRILSNELKGIEKKLRDVISRLEKLSPERNLANIQGPRNEIIHPQDACFQPDPESDVRITVGDVRRALGTNLEWIEAIEQLLDSGCEPENTD